MSNLNIKELSKKLDIAQETLRRWEARYTFLIVPRNQKGNRFYPPSVVDQFVKLKELKDQDKLDEEIIEFFGVVTLDPELPNLDLTSTQVNQDLKTALIEEIKSTLSNEIKVNNDMAFKLSSVSAEMGFTKGQLKFTQDENQDLKNQLKQKLSEVELMKSELKKQSDDLIKINFVVINKEKELIELQHKLNLTSIELDNKSYIIESQKTEIKSLTEQVNQLQHKLSEVGKLGFFEKLKFKYERN